MNSWLNSMGSWSHDKNQPVHERVTMSSIALYVKVQMANQSWQFLSIGWYPVHCIAYRLNTPGHNATSEEATNLFKVWLYAPPWHRGSKCVATTKKYIYQRFTNWLPVICIMSKTGLVCLFLFLFLFFFPILQPCSVAVWKSLPCTCSCLPLMTTVFVIVIFRTKVIVVNVS